MQEKKFIELKHSNNSNERIKHNNFENKLMFMTVCQKSWPS